MGLVRRSGPLRRYHCPSYGLAKQGELFMSRWRLPLTLRCDFAASLYAPPAPTLGRSNKKTQGAVPCGGMRRTRRAAVAAVLAIAAAGCSDRTPRQERPMPVMVVQVG